MMTWERVYTVEDIFDGTPTKGVADVNGEPHFFEGHFNTTEDRFTNVYSAWVVSGEILPLVMERWEIWCRWRTAFERGATDLGTHPALPAERNRYYELGKTIESELLDPSRKVIAKRGKFRRTSSDQFEVTWSEVG